MHSEIGSYSRFLSDEEKNWPEFGRKQGEKLVLLLRRITWFNSRHEGQWSRPGYELTCLHRQNGRFGEHSTILSNTSGRAQELAFLNVDFAASYFSVEASSDTPTQWVGRRSHGSIEEVGFFTGFGMLGGGYGTIETLMLILKTAGHGRDIELTQAGKGDRRFFTVTKDGEKLATLHPVRRTSVSENFVIELC